MMRALLIFLFFLILFAAVVLLVLQAPGFASFTYGSTTIELPLVKFAIALFILFTLIYFAIRLLGVIFNAPKRIQRSIAKRKVAKAHEETCGGLTKFIAGDWSKSEKLLLRGVEDGGSVAINYIWAARAAHQKGLFDERDQHLESAKKSSPDAQEAIATLQAELYLDQDMPEQALASISKQRDKIKNNSKVACLYAESYTKLEDWKNLAAILSDIKKCKDINPAMLSTFEHSAVAGLLKSSQSEIENIGRKYQDTIQVNAELSKLYAEALRRTGKHETAANFIKSELSKNWDSALVYEYGLLEHEDASQVLNKAEDWANEHDNDAILFLTLGRLCKDAKLWGKAKSYFESSIARKPSAETYAELAALHEHLDEIEEANECRKEGLKLATKIG